LIVEEGQEIIYPNFDTNTNILHLPVITVPNDSGEANFYQTELVLKNSNTLELGTVNLASEKNIARASYANFNPNTGMVYIPSVKIPNAESSHDMFYVNLQFVDSQTSPILSFRIDQYGIIRR